MNGPDPTAALRQVAGLAASLVDGGEAPSLSVALGVAGRTAARAWGRIDVETDRAAHPHTPYALASVTKPLWASALARLSSRGELDIDAPVDGLLGRPLPGLAPDTAAPRQPSVADLLAHRGGLGPFYRFFYADEARRPGAEAAVLLARHATVLRTPGTAFAYSNLGYAVVEEVVRRHTGASAAELLRREVFEPLGMTSAHVGEGYPEPGVAAERYGRDRVAYPDYAVEHPSASSAWLSAVDLVRFGLAHVPGSGFVDEPTRRRLLTDAVPGAGYGLGWRLGSSNGVDLVGHAGRMGGVSTELLVAPAHGTAVAVLANRTRVEAVSSVAAAAMTALLGQAGEDTYLTLAPWPQYADTCATPDGPDTPAPATAPAGRGRWEGTVDLGDEGVRVVLDVRDAEVSLAVGQGPPIWGPALAHLAHEAGEPAAVRAVVPLGLTPGGGPERQRSTWIELWPVDAGPGTTLVGALTSVDASALDNSGDPTEGGAPDLRMGDCVGYRVTLTRCG